MAVLVTGGAGYIGSHMVLALLDAGETVVVLDNLSTGFRTAVGAAARFVQGDFGDEALVERIIAEHEGILQVESEVGQGSVFTVCLPLKADTAV